MTAGGTLSHEAYIRFIRYLKWKQWKGTYFCGWCKAARRTLESHIREATND
jgi:glutaredoxin